MEDIIDFDRYPLDREGSPEWDQLVARSKAELAAEGMFYLEGFLKPGVAENAAAEVHAVMETNSHEHRPSKW